MGVGKHPVSTDDRNILVFNFTKSTNYHSRSAKCWPLQIVHIYLILPEQLHVARQLSRRSLPCRVMSLRHSHCGHVRYSSSQLAHKSAAPHEFVQSFCLRQCWGQLAHAFPFLYGLPSLSKWFPLHQHRLNYFIYNRTFMIMKAVDSYVITKICYDLS